MAEEAGNSAQGPVSKNFSVVILAAPYAIGIIFLIGAITGLGSFILNWGNWGPGAAAAMINTAGIVLALIAFILEQVISVTVIGAGSLIGAGAGGPDVGIAGGIAIAWSIIRDFMNLAFIGGLVYAAFAMILGLGTLGGKPGGLITKIIIAALLVNFSYFFAAAIIDASNLTTTVIYQEALLGGQERADADGVVEYLRGPLTNNLMTVLGLGEAQNITAGTLKTGENFLTFLYGLIAALILIATALAFFEMLFAFVKRFVVIIYLLIASPFAVVGFTGIPVIKEWGAAWWKSIAEQAIFPPVFFLLIAIAYKVAEKGKDQFISGNLSGILSVETTNNVSLLEHLGQFTLFACLVLGMVYLAVRVSQNISVGAANAPWTSDTFYKGVGRFGVDAFGGFLGNTLARVPINVSKGIASGTGGLGSAALRTPFARSLGLDRAIKAINESGRKVAEVGKAGADTLTDLGEKAYKPAFDTRSSYQKFREDTAKDILWNKEIDPDTGEAFGYMQRKNLKWGDLTPQQQRQLRNTVQGADEKTIDKWLRQADEDQGRLLKDAQGRGLLKDQNIATAAGGPSGAPENVAVVNLNKEVQNIVDGLKGSSDSQIARAIAANGKIVGQLKNLSDTEARELLTMRLSNKSEKASLAAILAALKESGRARVVDKLSADVLMDPRMGKYIDKDVWKEVNRRSKSAATPDHITPRERKEILNNRKRFEKSPAGIFAEELDIAEPEE